EEEEDIIDELTQDLNQKEPEVEEALSNGAHWADKYTKVTSSKPAAPAAKPQVGHQPAAPVTQNEKVLVGSGSNGNGSFLQGDFNLSQEESGRFKCTSKTIREGEDLDTPTWMRLKKNK